MSKVCKLSMKVKVSKWANLLYPIWIVQVLLGFKPYIPEWALKFEMVSREAGQ